MAEDWTAEKLSFYQDVVEDGFQITIREPGAPGTFNPDTLVYDDAVSDTDTTTYAIRSNYKASLIDGVIIKQNDSILIVPDYGLSSEISTDTQIVIDSDSQSIISVKKFNPANVTIGYEVQIRE